MRDVPRISHADMANTIRFLAAEAVDKAGSRHPGMPMGMSDLDGSVCAHSGIRPRRARNSRRLRGPCAAPLSRWLARRLADHRAEPAGEAWEIALGRRDGPTVLSRQDCPVLRQQAGRDNARPCGGYVLQDPGRGPRRIPLIATGSDVSVAEEARALLESDGILSAVVSMPSFELFAAMPEECRARVLGRKDAPRTGIEAATRFGWAELLGVRGRSVGMTGSGASDPAPDLFNHFGITPRAVVDRARAILHDEG